MEERKFGSFYIVGKVSEPHVDCQLSQVTAISLGDTVPGKELKWVESEGFWVADTEVCLNISWQQLNYIGYIFGHPVKIDGRLFLCRSPKISRKPGKPNEWNALLNRHTWTGTSFYHFWVQEAKRGESAMRYACESQLAQKIDAFNSGCRAHWIGFRPVLEPLPPIPTDLSPLVGQKVLAYAPGGYSFHCKMVEVNKYDIVLNTSVEPPRNCAWAIRDGKRVIIKRDCLLWLKEG